MLHQNFFLVHFLRFAFVVRLIQNISDVKFTAVFDRSCITNRRVAIAIEFTKCCSQHQNYWRQNCWRWCSCRRALFFSVSEVNVKKQTNFMQIFNSCSISHFMKKIEQLQKNFEERLLLWGKIISLLSTTSSKTLPGMHFEKQLYLYVFFKRKLYDQPLTCKNIEEINVLI